MRTNPGFAGFIQLEKVGVLSRIGDRQSANAAGLLIEIKRVL
jgi:hypothetical protein